MIDLARERSLYQSVHRQKFIIPPIEKKMFNSAHFQQFQTNNLNSASLKRNLLFTSTKQKSESQEIVACESNLIPKRPFKNSNLQKKKRRSHEPERNELDNFQNSSVNDNQTTKDTGSGKFKLIKTENICQVSWQKWQKSNINLTGKTFINSLKSKIQKEAVSPQLWEKQNHQVLKLKYSIRELGKLKQTIKCAKDNNELIKRLENQSSDKIRLFFGKYEKLIEETIR